MLEVIGLLSGVVFGAVGMLIAVQNHIRSLRQGWSDRWEEETRRKVDAEKKAYAAERDFNHLRGNQEQLKQAIGQLQDEVEELTKVLIEIRTAHNATYNRVENLAARFDNNTSGFGPRP
jgi:predicted  nucleic acid-binding Zn-ribbon protein